MSTVLPQTLPQTTSLANGEAEVLSYLNHATIAFRERSSRSPEELTAFNMHLDAVRKQFVFRDIAPQMQEQVFLCMPRSGPVEFEAASAMYMAAGPGQRFGVIATDKMTSCTPGGFNQGWCDALNARNSDGTRTFAWFCLLHADVCPQNADPRDNRPWLQVLMDEAESGGWDVLHAAVAIKDNRGITSTAVGLKDFAHQYSKARRITTTELNNPQLPSTFDHKQYLDSVGYEGWEPVLEAAGYPKVKEGEQETQAYKNWIASKTCMLNNTGVMLVRLTPTIRKFTGYRFQNKVVLVVDGKEHDMDTVPPECIGPDGDLVKGAVVPKFTPEDWDFGRWCANQGLKVGATRKVGVAHIGRGVYTTQMAWGTDQRDEYWFAN